MTDREPSAGDVLGGRYEVLGELGRGGMATVYRGRDLRLQRTVAVKVFRGGFAEAMDPRRIAREMQLLAGFDHPSVVAVLDASTGDGVFGAHLVMEFVHGSDLGAMLHAARGPLAADFARRIVADVAEALQALHDKGVVHQDVKPANILVPRPTPSATSRVTAKLTDFGIAQMVDDGRASDSILGTAAYLSPEQVRGAAPRPASDVYSLGLVLLEALTGRRAFPGSAAESAMARLQRRPVLPDNASPALADLLSRMTALDPAQRPGAGEVGALLRTQLAGRVTRPDAAHTSPTPIVGVPAVVPELEPEAGATAPHEPWPLGTGPVAAVSRTGSGPWTGTWTGTGTGTGTQAWSATQLQGPERRRRRFPAVLAVTASVLAAGVAAVAISAAAGVGAVATPKRTHRPVAVVSGAPSAPAEAVVVPLSDPSHGSASPSPSASAPSATPSTSRTPSASAKPSSTASTGSGLVAPVAPVVPSASASASDGSSSAPASSSPTPTDTDGTSTTDGASTSPEGD